MTIDELTGLLCQFPGDTPVVVVPDYEEGGRTMYHTRNVVQVLDEDGQPVLMGITSTLDSAKLEDPDA